MVPNDRLIITVEEMAGLSMLINLNWDRASTFDFGAFSAYWNVWEVTFVQSYYSWMKSHRCCLD